MDLNALNFLENSFNNGAGFRQWKTLSLTHVAYPSGLFTIFEFLFLIKLNWLFLGDLYGKFLALFTMLPFAIVVVFTTLVLFIRDVHVVSLFDVFPNWLFIFVRSPFF